MSRIYLVNAFRFCSYFLLISLTIHLYMCYFLFQLWKLNRININRKLFRSESIYVHLVQNEMIFAKFSNLTWFPSKILILFCFSDLVSGTAIYNRKTPSIIQLKCGQESVEGNSCGGGVMFKHTCSLNSHVTLWIWLLIFTSLCRKGL